MARRLLAGWFLAALCCVLTRPAAAGEPEWRHENGDEGNRVWSRPVEGSAVREYRVEMVLDAPLEAFWAVLTDWGGTLAEHPQVIEQTVVWRGEDEVVVYEVDDCSPIKPRDFAYRIRVGRDGDTRTLHNELANDHAPEAREGIVRVPLYRTRWVVSPEGDGTRAVYTVHYDAGGHVPARIYNLGMPGYLLRMKAWFEARAAERR